MPVINNATTWRTNPYVSRSYLWIDKPTIVFQCQVNGTITFPVADISYDNVSIGAYTDTTRFQTVLFGSTPGADDQGRGYLRKGTTNNTIYVNRMSQGDTDGTCNISDDSYVTVLDQFRPWARIPFIADGNTVVNGSTPALGTQFRDWDLTYTIGVNGSPVVNLGFGPAYASYGDPTNSDKLTMSFNAATYSKSYDSNIVSYLWNVTDGTITVGSTTTAAITVTFPVGRRYIHVTATDGNGNQTTRHLLIVNCKDGTAYEPIKDFDVSKHDLDLNGNSSGFSVRVRQSIPRSTYSDQMNVIYWKEEFYNNIQGSQNVIGSLGQTGCESIKFSGWHFTDDNSTNSQNNGYINEVTLNCLDITGWLDKLPGFSIEVDRLASPTSWSQMKSADMDKYFAEGILYYFSTARFITDWYDTNTGDFYAFTRLGSGESTLYKQIQELADRAIGYEFTCNEQGMMFVRANQNLLSTGNRTSVSIVTLTEDDIISIKYIHERFPKQHWNRGAFVLVSTSDITNNPMPQTSFWVAPGKAPGQGAESKDYNEQLALAASEGQARTANRYAEDNTDFGDIEITLIWPGDAGIEPAYGQWITLNISSAYAAQRGLNFTNTRLRIISVSWTEQSTPQGSVSTQKIIGRIETSGTASVDDTPPTSNVAPPPPIAPPPPVIATNTYNARHDGTSVIAHDAQNIALGNYYTTGARWRLAPMSGLSGLLQQLKLDPFSAFLSPAKSGVLPAYMQTTTGLFYISDILNPTATWTHQQVLSPYSDTPAIARGCIRPSSTTFGDIYMAYYDGDANVVQAYRFSGNGSAIVSHDTFAGGGTGCGMDIDNYGADEMIVGVRNGSFTFAIYQILNGGAPTRLTADIGQTLCYFVQKPLLTFTGAPNSSTGGSECFIFISAADRRLRKTANGGVTITDITPPTSSGIIGTITPSISSLVFTTNGNAIITVDNTGKIYTTQDGGVTWTAGATFTTDLYSIALGYYPTPVGGSYALYGGGTTGMFYSPNFGQTIVDATGDWLTSIGAISGSFLSVIPLY